MHIEAGQEQRLFCVPEEADASWTYQWQSEWLVALSYLSSAAESRPVLRIPQDAAAGLHVYTLTVEDALGRVIHTGRQEVVVHAAGFCDADGPIKGLGQAAFLCDEPDEADVLVAERILEVQLTDDVVGGREPASGAGLRAAPDGGDGIGKHPLRVTATGPHARVHCGVRLAAVCADAGAGRRDVHVHHPAAAD